MNFKLLLIFSLSLLTLASSQSIYCNFTTDNPTRIYTCSLTIDNPNGFDEFSGIDGIHMDGRTNDDVLDFVVFGITTIIPRVICDSFRFLRSIHILRDVGIQRFTENALSSCINLRTISSTFNPIAEIHPNFLRNNVNLTTFTITGSQLTSIPAELFSTTPNLVFTTLRFPLLRDLPADLFRNTPRVEFLHLDQNGLNIWRPEWAQSMTQLRHFSINTNNILEIPRNAINSRRLEVFSTGQNNFKVLDYFMFNDISTVFQFNISNSPVEAIDFNLIDMARDLSLLVVTGCKCIDRSLGPFSVFRQQNMVLLEPCFAAFDNRTLGKT